MTIPISSLEANVSQPQRTPQAMERIIGPDGEIILQWIGSPSWESYDFLEDYIKLRKKVLKPGAQGGKQQE
ncbi:hypothetical protein SAMN05216387_101195 [Nitrosovibrio tenuis]|uniref:Uncharacterized protein n=1 Tax=Nitrosovibrio tenuis TaxID=1233 RepID=A0A1H7G729_9PROT|nr:hypothetical protein SAMN05216387_101195 [Nitrosovibrio tenuis]